MSSCITTSFIGGYLYTMMERIVWDCIDSDLIDELIQLFLLLLREHRLTNSTRLSNIINMTDREKDKIFHDFVYRDENSDEFSEYDPRNRLFILYNKTKSQDILENVKSIILTKIRDGQTDRNYSSENLELYSILFYQFIEYLYLVKHNPDNEGIFSYDDSGNRIHIIEGKIAGSKRRKKTKKNKKNKKTKKNKKNKKTKNKKTKK